MSLLSELCGICYAEKPKYRCPRCRSETCSLPCYKRHQQRASCNGKRDPAEYLKKSQIATPAGIDRDYNYLKGVEREIESAGRETYDRGIGSKDVTKSFSRSTHPEGKLQQYLAANRIDVSRAPQGMSRQKSNRTRRTKRDHIFWTVEWVDQDGRAELQNDCHESWSIIAVHNSRLSEKSCDGVASGIHGEVEEYRDPGGKSKKRKRNEPEQDENPASNGRTSRSGELHLPVHPNLQATTDSPDTAAGDGGAMSELDQRDCHEPQEPIEQIPAENRSSESELDKTSSTPRNSTTDHFYLLKVGTPSASKVLIPLTPDSTLTETMRGQTVFEYPTYYVLPHAPSQLPAGYITEHEYLKARRSEEAELAAAIGNNRRDDTVGVSGGKPRQENSPSAQVDANKILDMLKRDVTR